MSNQPTTRQELYDQVRAAGKEEFTRQEMIRLGFWSHEQEESLGIDPKDLDRRADLRKELNSLRKTKSALLSETKALETIRKRRMEESRQRRKETLIRRDEEAKEKARLWNVKKESEIVYLGEEYSAQLNHLQNNTEELAKHGLPSFETVEELADAMGITVPALRFLAFSRRTSRTTHYARFYLPKKSGGKRLISAPKSRLKAVQHWILINILNNVSISDKAKGFVTGESIITNAAPHVKKKVVINMDLSDFFPTVSYKRVYGQFKKLGYAPGIATILALLSTEAEVTEVTLDGHRWFVSSKERFLPQGAPTSPALTNIICRRLDRKLQTLAENSGFTYTRYADDLTFSSDDDSKESVGKLIRRARYIVNHEGFVVHPEKTRVLRKGSRQEVTGLTVNEKVAVDRKTLRNFKALLFQIEKDGPEGKTWGSGPNLMRSVIGYANFVNMVNPDKGVTLKARAEALVSKYGLEEVVSSYTYVPPVESTEQEENWWKLW